MLSSPMLSSVEARRSPSPARNAAKGAAEINVMNWVRRVRSLTADGCTNVFALAQTPTLEAMKSPVEAVASKLPDSRFTEEGAVSVNHPQHWLPFWKRIRFWKVRPAAKRDNKGSCEEPIMSPLQLVRATDKGPSENRRKLGTFLCISTSRVRSLVPETCINPSTVKTETLDSDRFIARPGLATGPRPEPEGYLTCPSSPTRSSDLEFEGYLTCPSSPVGSSDSGPRHSTSAKLSAERSESLIDSTSASSDSEKCSAPGGRSDPQTNPNSAGSEPRRLRSSSDRGISESRKHTTQIASSDSRRSPTGRRSPESQQRRHSIGVAYESERYKSAFASSDPWRFSTGASDSNCHERQMAPGSTAGNANTVLKTLLAPSISLNALLSSVCTEEGLERQSDTRVLLRSSTNARRSSTDASARPSLSKWSSHPSESLDSTTIRTVPKIKARQEQYSNSNISWSTPLAEKKLDCFSAEEEPRQSIFFPGRQSTSSIPADHFSVYVGNERKKFFISSQVVTHQLFQRLLVRDEFNLEASDGQISFVLRCDAEYFQRFLFLVDQGKKISM